MHKLLACNVIIAGMRIAPSHRAEQLTQLLMNDRAEVLEQDNDTWTRVRCHLNKTEGWVLRSQFSEITEEQFNKSPVAIAYVGKDSIETSSAFLPATYFFAGDEIPAQAKKLSAIDFNPAVIREIMTSYLGVPYQWGSISTMGIDCSGLSKILYRFFNIHLTNFAAEQFQQGKVLDFLQFARCGDLAFFENSDGQIIHVGILLSAHEIIHASEVAGRVVIDRIDQEGIMNTSRGLRTHKLRLVKRLID